MAAVESLVSPARLLTYDEELQEKIAFVHDQFEAEDLKKLQVFRSPTRHFRFRTAISIVSHEIPAWVGDAVDGQEAATNEVELYKRFCNYLGQELDAGIKNTMFVLVPQALRDTSEASSSTNQLRFHMLATNPDRMPLETLSHGICSLIQNERFTNIMGTNYLKLGLACVKIHSVVKYEKTLEQSCIANGKASSATGTAAAAIDLVVQPMLLCLLCFQSVDTWADIDLKPIGDAFPHVKFVASAKNVEKVYFGNGDGSASATVPSESSNKTDAAAGYAATASHGLSENTRDETRSLAVAAGNGATEEAVLASCTNDAGFEAVSDTNVIQEELYIGGKCCKYNQVLGSFSNPNPYIAISTGDWLHSAVTGRAGGEGIDSNMNMLEIYCGVGSHTVALAPLFNKIVSVEINQKLVQQLEINIRMNGLTEKVVPMRAPSGSFCKRIMKSRKFKNIEFTWILVDPPRAGLDDITINLIKNFDHILYISCNPVALKRDLAKLKELGNFYSADFCILDHFPFTPHIECGVYLRKKE